MDKGKKFKKIEAGQFGIANPFPHEWSIEQDHRGFSSARDGLTASYAPHSSVRRCNPDAGMACMKGWIG
jgi:hypothetical protein